MRDNTQPKSCTVEKEKHIALYSGGKDSVAATHKAMTSGAADEVVFYIPGPIQNSIIVRLMPQLTGLENGVGKNDWPFRVVKAPQRFEEITAEEGTPSPRTHFVIWRRLKDRPIDDVRKGAQGELHCWTGIRRWESDRRMEVADAEGERGDERWYWHAPLVDWTDDDRDQYLAQHDIQPADVVQEIGRSCDCWCGCFGDRAELLDLEAAGFAEHAEYLRNLPTPDDCPKEQQEWAGYNWEKHDWAAADDLQMTLCSSCGAAMPDGGVQQ